MITVLALGIPLAVIGAFDAITSKFGSDTRPGFDERKHLA